MDCFSVPEKKYYESVYRKITDHGERTNKSICMKLFQRAIPNAETCEQIWKTVKGHTQDDILTKTELFKAMKYLAALQNGYTLENIDFAQLPPLPNPSFPKRSKVESSEKDPTKMEEIKLQESLNVSNLLQYTNGLSIIPEERAKNIAEKKVAEIQSDSFRAENKTSDSSMLSESVLAIMNPKKDYRPVLSNTNVMASSGILDNPFKSTLKDISLNQNILILETDEQLQQKPEKEKEILKKKKSIGDSQNGASKYNEHNLTYQEYMKNKQKIRVEIVGAKEISQGLLGMKSYTVYSIISKSEDAKETYSEHRYSDFEWLDRYLRSEPEYKGLNIPLLPEKKTFGNMNLAFLEERKEGLEHYLKELCRHHILHKDGILQAFFSSDANSFDQLKETITLPGTFSIDPSDLINFNKTYEYISANLKAWVKKDDDTISDGINQAQSIHQRLQDLETFADEFINSLQDVSKKSQVYTDALDATKTIKSNINHLIGADALDSLRELCDSFSNYLSNKNFEITRDENLIAGLKTIKEKIRGLKEGHGVFLQVVKNLKTNEELRHDKDTKLRKYQMEGKDVRKAEEEKKEIDLLVEKQGKEIKKAISNLQMELNELETVFDIIMNEELGNYNSIQNEYWQKYQSFLSSDNKKERETIDIIEF